VPGEHGVFLTKSALKGEIVSVYAGMLYIAPDKPPADHTKYVFAHQDGDRSFYLDATDEDAVGWWSKGRLIQHETGNGALVEWSIPPDAFERGYVFLRACNDIVVEDDGCIELTVNYGPNYSNGRAQEG
jgi:hypothetical protein